MRLDYLQKILAHVKRGLTCPRCQQIFGSAEIQVLGIRNQKIDLAIACPHCQTQARISAEVTTHKAKRLKRPAQNNGDRATVSAETHLTPEGLADLKASLSQLSAADIESLDSKSE